MQTVDPSGQQVEVQWSHQEKVHLKVKVNNGMQRNTLLDKCVVMMILSKSQSLPCHLECVFVLRVSTRNMRSSSINKLRLLAGSRVAVLKKIAALCKSMMVVVRMEFRLWQPQLPKISNRFLKQLSVPPSHLLVHSSSHQQKDNYSNWL